MFVLLRTVFGLFLLIPPDGVEFSADPVPGVEATDENPQPQQHQGPAVHPRIMGINPDPDGQAEQRRNHNAPADESRHTEAQPERLVLLAAGFELARLLLADALHESRPFTI